MSLSQIKRRELAVVLRNFSRADARWLLTQRPFWRALDKGQSNAVWLGRSLVLIRAVARRKEVRL